MTGTITRDDLTTATDTSSFTLSVLDKGENNLPILEKLQLDVDQLNELTLRVENLDEESQIELGPIYDQDGDTVSVESVLLPALFNYD